MNSKGPTIKIRDGVFMVRGQRVVNTAAAAAFYDVSPDVLMRAVARNKKRFTKEQMFRLTLSELIVLPKDKKFKNTLPVFTESGVAILSTVLHSPKAVRTNIEIIRQTIRLFRFVKQ